MAISAVKLFRAVPFLFSTVAAFPSTRHFVSLSFTSLASAKPEAAEVSNMPEVKVGDKIPDVTLKELTTSGGDPSEVQLTELIKGEKVAIFGVPGAFTPGCSKSHLPSFINAQSELKQKGVDKTICVATNDPFVMEAWGRTSGGFDAGIRFLSDDAGALTKALGLELPTGAQLRTKRFSLIAEDGKVTHYFSSAKQSSDTWAPAVVSAL